MSLKLRNSLGDRLEEFQPQEAGNVRMYHCGPTVKESADIAKFRAYLLADVLRRCCERAGQEVTQVMNITDVGHLNEFEEDIVEIAAARTGMYAWELAEMEERKFHEEREALSILDAHQYPRARENIDSMIDLIQHLEEKGVCYQAGGNVYLDVHRFPEFGKLSGKSLAELESLQEESRTRKAPKKKHPVDIDLWRTDAVHQLSFDSPWGRGFPGWHVECAAMSRKYLGGSFDIHTGSHDNLYPHHECEIAQVETLTGKPLANYWLHTGPVQVDGAPMNRQSANRVTVRELLDSGFRGSVLRVALLSAHYRDTLDFGDAALDWARESVNLLIEFRQHLDSLTKSAPALVEDQPAEWIVATEAKFQAALDDDLDFPSAMRAVRGAVEEIHPEEIGNPHSAIAAIESWNQIFAIRLE